MKKINVVMAGIGHDHAHDTFKYLTSKDSSFNLLGVIIEENDNGNFAKWQDDYSAVKHFTIEEALNLDNLDAAIIETDDSKLTEYALKFAQKGIPIHMDKPGGQNKKEFDLLIKMCKNNNIPLHLGYMYRYNPAIKEVKRICQSGAIGKVYSIEAHMSISHSKEKRQWLNNFKGGMMNFLGCHLVDLVVSIMGKPDEVVPCNSKSSDDVGEDIGMALLKYKNVASTIYSSAIEFNGFARRHIVVCAEKMTIRIEPTEVVKDGAFYSCVSFNAPEIIPNVPIGVKEYGPFDRYQNMFEEFALIVKKEITNPYSPEYEQLVHDILLKACCF